MKKKILSLLLAVVITVGILPLSVVPAAAESTGKYIVRSWDDTTKKVVETETDIPDGVTVLTSRESTVSLGAGKWYFVTAEVTVPEIEVNGTENEPTNLILADDCALTVTEGIRLTGGHVLHIYGQSGDTGTLTATGVEQAAGIGGKNDHEDGGTLTVYGGTVTAYGGTDMGYDSLGGAGIGGGCNGNGGTLTVYGGTVTAYGGKCGAGIGSGDGHDAYKQFHGGTVTIYGGIVNANGGEDSAGIGGGLYGSGGTVTVYGGIVNANGGTYGAGIGSGSCPLPLKGGTVTVFDGIVNANGGYQAAGIGGGRTAYGADVEIYGGTVTAFGGEESRGIGAYSGTDDNGTLTVHGDLFVIKAGNEQKTAGNVSTYNDARYAQIHYHNAKTLVRMDDSRHKCSVCGAVENHTYKNDLCTCGELLTAKFDGVSLTLDSNINMNFYMQLSEEAQANGKMVFTVGSRKAEGEMNINENNGRRYFACPLNALEMAETVRADFTCGDVSVTQEFSVEQYIDTVVNEKDESGEPAYNEEMRSLARKIANYGYYIQLYLQSIHKNVKIGENGYMEMMHFAEDDINVSGAKISDRFFRSEDTENLVYYGRSVYFDSATSLNYYVITKDGTAPDAACAGKTVEVSHYGGSTYIISVKGITATELSTSFTVNVSLNGDGMSLEGSVMDYCAAVKKKSGQTAEAINGMTAFYEYYRAANTYANVRAYTVTFDMNKVGEPVSSQKIKKGERAQKPADPIADDFVFEGWYKDQLGTVPWNFNTDTVTKNVTIYAKWTALTSDSYTVTCNVLDPATQNAPLKGAIVKFRGEEIKTDESGQVVFEGVPYGAYRLSVECDGYKTCTENVTVQLDLERNLIIRKMLTVNLAVTEGAMLYDKDGNIAPASIEVPYGTKVMFTLENPYKNTDPTLTFTDPDDGSTINFYSRRTSDLYKIATWRVPMFVVTESGKTIVAEWKIDSSLLRSLAGTNRDGEKFKYLPVFSEGSLSLDIVFFDENEKVLPKSGIGGVYKMSDLLDAYYYYMPGYAPSFTAIRIIPGVSYDEVYGSGGSGQREVRQEWIDGHLLDGETVEKLSDVVTDRQFPDYRQITVIPKIDGVKLSEIYNVYNGIDRIGCQSLFISCVADSEEEFYVYDAAEEALWLWWLSERGDFMKENQCVLISKQLH